MTWQLYGQSTTSTSWYLLTILKRVRRLSRLPSAISRLIFAWEKEPCLTCPGATSNLKSAVLELFGMGRTSLLSQQARQSFTHSLPRIQGVSACVVSMHTVKPLDTECLFSVARQCKTMLTVEEHRLPGGLGEACAAALLQAGIGLPFRMVGIPDEYTVTGSQAAIFRHYGISMEGLSKTALALTEARRPMKFQTC